MLASVEPAIESRAEYYWASVSFSSV